jgi:hypothetical protein
MTATKRAVDMTNVKDAGNFNTKHKTEGDYKAIISKVEDGESKSGNAQWIFTIELVSDRRATYPFYCGFDDKQAWKIRNLCIASGMAVPKKKVMVDPNKLVGKEIGISLEDDEYEGKMRSRISATFPVSEVTEETRPKSSTPSTSDEVDDEELDEMDLEEV